MSLISWNILDFSLLYKKSFEESLFKEIFLLMNNDNIIMKTKYPHFNQLDSLEKLKIILNPDKEILPSVCNFIKRSLEARI
jgi:hypothetical protein